MEGAIKQYYPLGNKTLYMIVLRRGAMFAMLLPLLIAGVVALNYVPSNYLQIAINAILGYALLLLVALVVVIFFAWLEYIRFGISISNEDLRIKRGLIATEEIGIPYRRIRDIKIQRSLLDQLFGVSDIIIILSDFEESENVSEESTVFLPSIEKNMAQEIQDTILKKSQVEQMHLVSPHDDMLKKV